MKGEKAIYTPKKILDHGFVRLVAYLGNDDSIVDSARVSYGEGTKHIRNNRALIRFLLSHKHTSPFEQIVCTFHVKLPLFVARQWQRHRTARLNEISARYSVMPDEFYLPEGKYIAKQSNNNKQGREDPATKEEQDEIRASLLLQYKQSYKLYQTLLDKGIAREIARICLPLAIYTEMYWQIDLHNLFHFLSLRMDEHAQYEIRAYADEMYSILKDICPLACEAFQDFVLEKTEFYAKEYPVIKQIIDAQALDKEKKSEQEDLLEQENNMKSIIESVDLLSSREKKALLEKLSTIFGDI